MTTIEDKRLTSGFKKGMGLVGSAFKSDLIKRLWHGFGLSVNSPTAFYRRVNGETPLTPIEVDFVESEFTKIGIPAEKIWDLPDSL